MTVRKGKRLPLEELQPYLLDVPDPIRFLNLRDAFGNDNPVEVEVGFGKGLFLLTAAQQHPNTNFLGIEIERAYQLFTATRIAKRALRNVRLARADARRFFRDCLPAQALRAVHVYFPDPWWKKRHHKRRVFTPEFAADCTRVLRFGGRLFIATDVEEYVVLMTDLLAQVHGLRRLPLSAAKEPAEDVGFLTNFERKAGQQGRPVFRAEYERIP